MEKLCVFCEHWNFSGGSPGYSEMTPGWSASMHCSKGVWHDDLDDIYDENKFREIILTAGTCPHFAPPSQEK